MENGELLVVSTGIEVKLKLFVSNWDMAKMQVSTVINNRYGCNDKLYS